MGIPYKKRTRTKHIRIVEGSIISSSVVPARKRVPRWTLPVCGLSLPLLSILMLLLSSGILQAKATATIRIHPVFEDKSDLIRLTATIAPTAPYQSQARLLIAARTSAQVHVQATGVVQKSATEAHGTLMFFNPESFAQTVAAGTTLQLSQGFQAITAQAVTIPPGTPSQAGSAPVPAQVTPVGAQGNIAAFTLNGLCLVCHGTNIAVQNPQSFSGGQDAESFTVVSQADLDTVARVQEPKLITQATTLLRGQVRSREQLGTPVHCASQIKSNAPVGAKATQISIEVTSTCTALAYQPQDVRQKAAALFISEVARSLDPHQVLSAPVSTRIQDPGVVTGPGTLSFLVHTAGQWIYRLSNAEQAGLIRHLAGKPRELALSELQKVPGIQEATIEGVQGNDTLPRDPGQFIVQIVFPA